MNGELTSDFLDQFLATVLAKGTSDKVIFTGTIGAYYISRFNRSGQGAFWRPEHENVHGVQVDGFLSGVYGYEIPVIVKKEWANYPSGVGGYNGNLFVVDMANVERRPLRNRDDEAAHEPPEPRRRPVRRRVPDGAGLGDRSREVPRTSDRDLVVRSHGEGRP